MTSRALAGGRAPRSWQRGIGRAVAPLAALRRSTAWLATLVGIRPRLRDEPLLGRCFTALALRSFSSGELKEAAGKPAPVRPRSPEPPARRSRPPAVTGRRPSPAPGAADRTPVTPIHRRFKSRLESAARARSIAPGVGRGAPATEGRIGSSSPAAFPVSRKRGAEAPLALETRLGRDRLERLAAPDRTSSVRAGEPDDREASLAGADVEVAARTDLPAGPRDRTSHRVWLERLSRRIGRVLSLNPAPAGGAEIRVSSAPPTRRGVRRDDGRLPADLLERLASPAPEPPAEVAEPLAAGAAEPPAAWRFPLDGETAPRELLERCQGPAWPAEDRGDGARAARAVGRTEQLSRRQSSGFPAEAPHTLPAPLVPVQDSAPERGEGETMDSLGPAGTLLPAPPSLPPFLQQRGAGDEAARRPDSGGKSVLPPPHGPAVPPAEDLSGLAANLKRILDEEARRHGIPV